jgi:hypothetical protein
VTIEAYLEVGKKRVFACALAWPGWARSGPDEDEAVKALLAYAGRYKKAVGVTARGLEVPLDTSGIKVVEQVNGNATTDFGVPAVAPSADGERLEGRELTRQLETLEASWEAFDAAAKKHARKKLRTGPRGGGRDIKKMTEHVFGGDQGYLSKLGDRYRGTDMTALREAFLEAASARARGEQVPEGSRVKKLWTPRYAIRRSAWHALDHAWEIEDRAG